MNMQRESFPLLKDVSYGGMYERRCSSFKTCFKDVIQSSRKSQALEESNLTQSSSHQSALLEPPARSKRRHLSNQLRKSYVRI